MFETPCMITMIIAATRMHCYPVDFASRPADLYAISSLFFCEDQADRHHTDYAESD